MTMDEDTVQYLYKANNVQQKRIQELEKTLDQIRFTSGRSYKLPVTSVAAMNNMRIINRRCVQTLKGGD